MFTIEVATNNLLKTLFIISYLLVTLSRNEQLTHFHIFVIPICTSISLAQHTYTSDNQLSV